MVWDVGHWFALGDFVAKGSPIDAVGVAVATMGGILVYAGIRGYSIMAVIGNLVTGKPITNGVTITNPLQTPSLSSPDTSSPAYSTPTGSTQSIGQALASQMGWEGSEWTALQTLWNGESGWNAHAQNPSSGAYGIPQALPYTKMPKAAWPESKGGKSDPATQIQWGLNYIKGRYGSPSMALAFWQRQNPHWY